MTNEVGRQHIDTEYEAELSGLLKRVLFMGARVEESLREALEAYGENDLLKARRVVEADELVDRLEVEIDGACLQLLARRQPVASDLRFVTTTLKIVTDLERISDLASNVGERVLELGTAPPVVRSTVITDMGEIASKMLHDAMDALVNGDAKKAALVVERDSAVDSQYSSIFPTVVGQMTANPELADFSMRVLSIAKYVERIADHATNLAQMVVFMVEGRDVRHRRAMGINLQ